MLVFVKWVMRKLKASKIIGNSKIEVGQLGNHCSNKFLKTLIIVLLIYMAKTIANALDIVTDNSRTVRAPMSLKKLNLIGEVMIVNIGNTMHKKGIAILDCLA